MKKQQWTIIDIVNWTTDYFSNKGIESPRLNIELMLCSVLNISRVEVYTQYDKPLKDIELSVIRDMILKRADGMPLQYILGKTGFLGLDILLNDSVMIPRPETELLVQKVLDDIGDKREKLSILDIGTGSGCIALALAVRLPLAYILAVDSSYFALMTAKNNASNLAVTNINFNQCDILKEIPSKEKFDIVVSNPPYIPMNEYEKLDIGVKRYEPKNALTDGSDGLTFYKRIAQILPELLKPDGKFYFEIGYNQKESVMEIFQSHAYVLDFYDDYSGIPRILKGRK
ncbi:peptide chain release factor N(5)-glutamine methyltransferase [Bacteroidota bacterium]